MFDYAHIPELSDFRILSRVAMGLGIADIARGLGVFPATATASLDRLVDVGYLAKTDGRYHLTDMGVKHVETLEVEAAEVARDLMGIDRLMHTRANAKIAARMQLRELLARVGRGESLNYAECMRLEDAKLAVRVKKGDKVYAELTPYGCKVLTRSGKTGVRRGAWNQCATVVQQ